MFQEILEQIKGKKNIVFLGEAGSGKSEIAINFACALRRSTFGATRMSGSPATGLSKPLKSAISRLMAQS